MQRKDMKVLAIDPSVRNIGFAVCRVRSTGIADRWHIGHWELEGQNYLCRCADLVDRVRELLVGQRPSMLIIEWPTFQNSQRGHVAAVQGYTIDLAGIAMFLAGSLGMNHRQIIRYTPDQWKGSVSKDITRRRFMAFAELDRCKVWLPDHTTDAAMMLKKYIEEQKLEINLQSLQITLPKAGTQQTDIYE